MTAWHLRAPSRLHFGLLAWGPDAPRQFGGVGLMIDRPGLAISALPAAEWSAEGPLAERALRVARAVHARLAGDGLSPTPARLVIHHAPPEHVGLGTGTQLSLSVARLAAALAGRPEAPVETLAAWTGRGRRSGIGLHGFARGGLIVDGGHRVATDVPPLLSRLAFPPDWAVLVVLPSLPAGLHGSPEAEVFSALPAIPSSLTDRLCRLVLLGLLPAVVDRDLPAFGAALTEIQGRVGQLFSAAQGGVFARPESALIADVLRAEGLHGVGQSSWGPALYGFSNEPAARRDEILQGLRRRFCWEESAAFWALGDASGATLWRGE